MGSKPCMITETNLSRAWAKAMLALMETGVEELSPLMVRIDTSPGLPKESNDIRSIVDSELARFDRVPCETNASTIFPQSLWVPEHGHQALVARYKKVLPRLRKLHPMNRRGLYFERLVSYGPEGIDQLAHIIGTWSDGNHRRSELQATLLDPSLDQSNETMKGFPCLQQITFAHDKQGLTLIGYYGVQYIFDRAYGNYLGLLRLGQYIAGEMGLPFKSLVCVSGIAMRGKPTKTQLVKLAPALKQCLGQAQKQIDVPKVETIDPSELNGLFAPSTSPPGRP